VKKGGVRPANLYIRTLEDGGSGGVTRMAYLSKRGRLTWSENKHSSNLKIEEKTRPLKGEEVGNSAWGKKQNTQGKGEKT